MRKLFIIITSCFLFVLSGYVVAEHILNEGKMPLEEIKKRWGDVPFDEEKFKKGDIKIRASMVYDLIKNEKKFIGRSPREVESVLGSHDAYYITDVIPAYFIEKGKVKGDDVWQVVFDLSRKNDKRVVSEIFVNKN